MDRQHRDSLVLPALGRGLIAAGPLVVPATPHPTDPAEVRLPIRKEYLLEVPGPGRLVNAIVLVADAASPPLPGTWPIVIPLGDRTVRIKFEA